jgi:hypothetical protein
MGRTETYDGPEKRKSVRFDALFPVLLKLYVRGRTGIITVLINGETVNISLEGMCVELGLSDYVDVISLVEAAMNKIGVDVGVKLIAGGMNFRATGEVMWFKRKGEDHLRMGVRFMGMNRDDRSIWNRLLLSLAEEPQTVEASNEASVPRSS